MIPHVRMFGTLPAPALVGTTLYERDRAQIMALDLSK